MTQDFHYDIFLSHSAKDKAVVRPLAERLRKDGLEHSRVLVLCMSANAFGSDWAQLEAGTFRFRDPLNKERRFIPLQLDDAPIKGSLAQFLYINWRPADREPEYAKLLEACRPAPRPKVELTEAQRRLEAKVLSLGHTAGVNSVAWSSEGRRALSGALNGVWREWDLAGLIADQEAGKVVPAVAPSAPKEVQYRNAKVLLVGDTHSGTSKPAAKRCGACATTFAPGATPAKAIPRS